MIIMLNNIFLKDFQFISDKKGWSVAVVHSWSASGNEKLLVLHL
jgi:hypothetical protein